MSGKICGRVFDKGSMSAVVNAQVSIHTHPSCTDENRMNSVLTNKDGKYEFSDLVGGTTYYLACNPFNVPADVPEGGVTVKDGENYVDLPVEINLSISLKVPAGTGDSTLETSTHTIAGKRAVVCLEFNEKNELLTEHEFTAFPDGNILRIGPKEAEVSFVEPGKKRFQVRSSTRPESISRTGSSGSSNSTHIYSFLDSYASLPDRQTIGGQLGVRLDRTRVFPTPDQALWVAIRNRTRAIGFDRYRHFIDRVLGMEERETIDNPRLTRKLKELGTNLHGVGAYETLRVATEIFLLFQCGIRIEEDHYRHDQLFQSEYEAARLGRSLGFDEARCKLEEYLGKPPQLPYITEVIKTAFPEWADGFTSHDRVLTGRVNEPCLIELIWSYWHEEGMLAQTMNAITRRFQNVRAPGERDPLAHLEIDPLRPLNNIIWGNIQEEYKHLSVKRRAYEYEHEYGLCLYGKAARNIRPADSRSKFLEGFHNLLYLCSVFFKEDNDTTVISDGYPLLNALKEVNLSLAQGAHNQFGDLPWTARTEMLLQQWMLARPEIRDFLQSRAMVPYKEAWMPQVDTMKTLQGWTDVTVTNFRDLAVYGEQILLSVRYGNWIVIVDEDSAKNWARYFRPEIQGYLHSYRAVTGIDLTNPDTIDATVPAVLLQKRLALQQQRAR